MYSRFSTLLTLDSTWLAHFYYRRCYMHGRCQTLDTYGNLSGEHNIISCINSCAVSLFLFGTLYLNLLISLLHIVLFRQYFWIFFPFLTIFAFIMTEQTPKIKTLLSPSFQLMPSWLDNIEAWLRCAVADFYKHDVTELHT